MIFGYQDTPIQPTINVAETVGQRDADRVFDREREFLSSQEDLLYRFRPDLSYTAE